MCSLLSPSLFYFGDYQYLSLLVIKLTKKLLTNSKLGNLEKGYKQEEAAPLMDKIVFDKVVILFIIISII